MAKFKVDDPVRIKKVYYYYDGNIVRTNHELSHLIGQTAKIVGVSHGSFQVYEIKFNRSQFIHNFGWTDEELEMIQPSIDNQGNVVRL